MSTRRDDAVELNRREATVAIAGMVCLPFCNWFGFRKTKVGFSNGEHWYWVSVPGDHTELLVDWLVISTMRETGKVVQAEVMFVGLGKFPLRRGKRVGAETSGQARMNRIA